MAGQLQNEFALLDLANFLSTMRLEFADADLANSHMPILNLVRIIVKSHCASIKASRGLSLFSKRSNIDTVAPRAVRPNVLSVRRVQWRALSCLPQRELVPSNDYCTSVVRYCNGQIHSKEVSKNAQAKSDQTWESTGGEGGIRTLGSC